ncbi:DUF6441 family protein [Pararhodobacter aggregans]|uniref:DUF6441 family protein n=1 Tax=Pararhodobacter aggregans TaxID=404875 RepID=UPI003A957719
MRFNLVIDGSFAEIFKGEERAARVAVRGGIKDGTEQIKGLWRGQVTSAGLGDRLARTVRSNVYPNKPSTNAAGLVWSRAPKIIDAFDRGVTIRSADGFWLAIPTRNVRLSGGARGRKMTPAEWERKNNRRLHFVYQKTGPSFLVDKGGDPLRERIMGRRGVHRAARRRKFREIGEIIFLLVPQVRLKKRLDLERDARAVGNRLPSLVVSNWPRS